MTDFVDPDTIVFDQEQCKNIMVVGNKNSGKSVLLKYLTTKIVKELKIFRVYIFSGTAGLNKIYRGWSPFVYELDFERLNIILERQRINAVAHLINPKIELKKILIILDDYVGIVNMQTKKATEVFNMLATQGRHRGIVTAFICHKWSSNTNICRNASDYIFVTKTDIDSIQDKTTGIYAQQHDYDAPKDLWKDYVQNTKRRFSFMCIQSVDPYSPSVMWCNPIDLNNNPFRIKLQGDKQKDTVSKELAVVRLENQQLESMDLNSPTSEEEQESCESSDE